MARGGLRIVWLLILAPIVVITACGQQGAVFSILPTGQIFQGSVQSTKLDILWVIDNSGSMLTKQQNLANSFNSFIDTFSERDYDFNMAIVTTDYGADGGVFQGTPSVISDETANFDTVFKTNVVVGATGAANARALDVINLALSDSLLTGSNTGFLRSDAHLAVIILSDADDNDSTTSVAATDSFLEGLKPAQTDSETGREQEMYTVHAVIDDQDNPGPTPCVGSEDGIKFRELANLSEGAIEDICAADFSDGLNSLAQNIAQFISQVLLSREPQTDTIVVLINGTEVPESTTNGWEYKATNNKIVFHGTYIPSASDTISVTFTPTDIIR